MGKFLDEVPKTTYKGKFLDDEPVDQESERLSRNPLAQYAKGLKEETPFAEFLLKHTPGYNEEGRTEVPSPSGIVPTIARVGGQFQGMAPLMIPSLRGASAIPKIPSLLKTAIGMGGFEGARAITQGRPSDAPKEAGMGALTTLAIGAPLEGLAKVAKPMAGRLMNSVLRPIKNEMTKGKNLGLRAVEEGYSGSKKGILSKATTNAQKYEDELQAVLSKSKSVADISPVYQKLDAMKEDYFGNDAAVKAIDSMKKAIQGEFKKFGQYGRLPVSKANEIKRSLYNQVKPNQFNTSEAPHLAQIRKTAARAFKEAIEAAEPSVKGINQKLGTASAVRNAMETRLATEQKSKLFPLLETIAAGGGLGFGRPEVLGALALRRVLGSSPFQTGLAQNLSRYAKANVGRKLATIGISERLNRNKK